MAGLADDEKKAIDAALSSCRQGDVFLGQGLAFVHLFRITAPLTPASEEAAADVGVADAGELATAFSAAPGFVVTTQTCDIVRPCAQRPFIDVSPLVEVSAQHLNEIRLLMRPQYAYLPAFADLRLVADLDRSMTIEKSAVSSLVRQPGVKSDAEVATFAQALARKRSRFAFPDAFNASLGKLQERLTKRAGKNSEEGAHVDALAEIRVAAAPNWEATAVAVTFWFIKARDPAKANWAHWANEWTKLIDQSGAYTMDGTINIARLDDMKASDYVGSHRLDLDQLTR